MKKNWSNPQIKTLELNETKETIVCPELNTVSGGDDRAFITIPQFTAEQCCGCKYNLDCKFTWKYPGPCNS